MISWAIKWKSYSLADLIVNENQKLFIEAEWTKIPELRKSQQFTLAGETYSYSSIDSITRASQSIDNAVKLLYSAEAPKGYGAVINKENEAVAHWYKKFVTLKEYENYYGRHPSYRTLSRESNGVWVAFRIIKKENGSILDGVEPCTDYEEDKLWNHN